MIYTGFVHLDANGYGEVTELVGNTPGILSTTASINGKNTGATALYTVPAGKRAIITEAKFLITAASSISLVPTLSIGQNSSSYNDIVVASALTGLTALNQVYSLPLTGVYVSVAAAGVINLNISIGATATTMTFTTYLIGFLV